jgi:hypothetical protein
MHFLRTVTVMVDEFCSQLQILARPEAASVWPIRCMCCRPLRGTYAWYASAHTIHMACCAICSSIERPRSSIGGAAPSKGVGWVFKSPRGHATHSLSFSPHRAQASGPPEAGTAACSRPRDRFFWPVIISKTRPWLQARMIHTASRVPRNSKCIFSDMLAKP